MLCEGFLGFGLGGGLMVEVWFTVFSFELRGLVILI